MESYARGSLKPVPSDLAACFVHGLLEDVCKFILAHRAHVGCCSWYLQNPLSKAYAVLCSTSSTVGGAFHVCEFLRVCAGLFTQLISFWSPLADRQDFQNIKAITGAESSLS